MTNAPIEPKSAQQQQEPPKKENLFINLLLNIVIPTLILSKLSGEQNLGPEWAIVVALAFPVAYGIKDFGRAKKVNLFSALGVFSILMTGGMSLLHLDPKYIAYKEAGVPLVFGIATLLSLKTRYPLIRTFLFNEQILQVDKVNNALDEHNNQAAFEKALRVANYVVAGSFFLSSVLNYALAKYLLVSQPGTEAFNAELGKMTALSFPVIAVPATLVMMGALFYLFSRIKSLTQLELEDIMIQQ